MGLRPVNPFHTPKDGGTWTRRTPTHDHCRSCYGHSCPTRLPAQPGVGRSAQDVAHSRSPFVIRESAPFLDSLARCFPPTRCTNERVAHRRGPRPRWTRSCRAARASGAAKYEKRLKRPRSPWLGRSCHRTGMDFNVTRGSTDRFAHVRNHVTCRQSRASAPWMSSISQSGSFTGQVVQSLAASSKCPVAANTPPWNFVAGSSARGVAMRASRLARNRSALSFGRQPRYSDFELSHQHSSFAETP